MDNSTEKPKIIVDDDWKTKVQAEKEQLRRQTEPTGAESQDPLPSADTAKHEHVPLPVASFLTLVESLAAQSLSMLGQLPGPDGKRVVDLEYAKHLVDTLGVLEEKTKGNLSRDEAAVLEQVLHDLRMLFVTVSRSAR